MAWQLAVEKAWPADDQTRLLERFVTRSGHLTVHPKLTEGSHRNLRNLQQRKLIGRWFGKTEWNASFASTCLELEGLNLTVDSTRRQLVAGRPLPVAANDQTKLVQPRAQ